ncbi:hypothetical protein BV25DRAFT_1829039 [Artomyces pyxidatus]|uniref:Uncharacterized protein n=1 Tax=Artomyces pyxidatus TaxID=48021 RepID=A0ACB8SST7_9AGAM|nr:hypothetical protein BV25DRAFT_1829039 [Artomyces pyxidatus]
MLHRHNIFLPNRCLLRLLHSSHSISNSLNESALDAWIQQPKQLTLSATLHPDHLADLYITLPTRDATPPPPTGAPLGFGHHLAFFHPRTPAGALRADGTDADFCPPAPFVRRMWAGGRIAWRRALVVGERAKAVSTVARVEKKGFERGAPMVFVTQRVEVRGESGEAGVVEERAHVYLPAGVEAGKRRVRAVDGLPSPDFSFMFTPTPTTLFRFSALTFNGHYIHLDRDYAQHSEGYPERLVHGPLTALMLLETLVLHHPDAQLKTFEYRALNPVVVNRELTIYGAWESKDTVSLWTQDRDGVVGMRGTVSL